MTHRIEFRDPPRWARTLTVAVVMSVPGALAGGLIALWAGHFVMCLVIGAVIAAITGAVWET